MKALQSYPVFEADQVLSNSHLNNLLNYLEQQGRLSRIKLLGRGIVHGLEINSTPSAIAISKGCGLSSQGFLIQLCDTNYTHFVSYTPPVLPSDLYFLTHCSEEDRNKIPYYSGKDLLELIADSDKETEGKRPLTSLNLGEYVVVIFLEAEQIDLKNCDTQDCNDKGSRMDFVQRTLLVNKKHFQDGKSSGFRSILLKRYNVPGGDLEASEDVLNGFMAITDDEILESLQVNMERSWDRFSAVLGFPETNPFSDLNLISLRKQFETGNGKRIYAQYFYDFVDDLLKAYLEFRGKVREVLGESCTEGMEFPLHLNLGLANENTRLGRRNSHRHFFIPAPSINGHGKDTEEAASLLERMVAMVQGFTTASLNSDDTILITPSAIGRDALTYRAIPYYYDWARVNALWNFGRAYNGNDRFNVGYRAALQADAPEPIKNPLLYDIERYNAFRIEGHIGKNYRTALARIMGQRNDFNLPFDVIALNAADLSAILNGKNPRCHVEDLESDFRVMITGIVCQLQQIIAYVGNLRPRQNVVPDRLIVDIAARKDFYISKNLVDMQKVIRDDLSKNQPISLSNTDIIKNLALKDVEEGEKLADFVGMDVSRFIVDQKQFYDYIIQQPDLLVIFLQQLAEIVKYLLSVDLNSFEEEGFTKLWSPYSKTVESLIRESSKSDNEDIRRFFNAGNSELLFKCANEKLFALKDEYLARLEAYHAAVNFAKYFKKHPGMEHKAGVTKGGTFILVYNGETLPTFFIPPLLDVNINPNFGRNPLASIGLRETARATVDLINPAMVSTVSPITKRYEGLSIASKRTDYGFASDLIKNLNLGDASKAVLDALMNKDKEIREKASQIPKGTVIADFYLPYMITSDCPPIAYVIQEPEEPVNEGPIADAGADRTIDLPIEGAAETTLDGSNSKDPEGKALTFAWAKTSGPSAEIAQPNAAKTIAKVLEAGSYVFTLKVTDDLGATAEDSVTVTVNARQNIGPIAEAGPDQIITQTVSRPTSTVLDGSASKDQDGRIVAYVWEQQSGPPATIEAPKEQKTAVLVQAVGVYLFSLKVTDDKGASASDNVKVTVEGRQNQPPTANAGEDQRVVIPNPNSPANVILDGSGSLDPEGRVLTFNWSQVSGPMTVQIQSPDKEKAQVSGLMPGSYVFGLKVTDDAGTTGSDSVGITVVLKETDDRPTEKDCGSLGEIIKAFESFESGNKQEQLNQFAEFFQSYGQVKEFFTGLRQVSGAGPEKQLSYVQGFFSNLGLDKEWRTWLDQLQNIILEIRELRGLALQLYRVLALLSMYLVCIQNSDFDKGEVPLAPVFVLMVDHADPWVSLRDNGQFGRLEVQIIGTIGNEIARAIAQTEKNGEAAIKPQYLGLLKKWGEVI